MIDHDRARELAAAALDFDLSDEDDRRLLAHLVDCASCRVFAEGLEADRSALAGLAAIDAPADLRASILAAVAASSDRAGLPDAAAESLPERPRRTPSTLPTIPKRYRWPLVMTTAAAVIVVLVAGGLVWRPGPVGNDLAVASPSTGTPSGTGALPAGTPLPPMKPDSRLAASPWSPVADLTADEVSGGVVDVASGFFLTSLDGTPAIEAARRLTVTPPIAFSTAVADNGRSVHIYPTEPLVAGAAYRFTLAGTDGRTVGSWAFQAHQPLRVVGTVPGNTESGVALDTGIEVTFDQDGVADAASHVSISPTVGGRFEQHGRTVAFVPDQQLAPETVYTVTVTAGVAVGATGERLEKDVTFRFETATAPGSPAATTFQFSDDLFESATKDRPLIAVWAFQDGADEGSPPPPPTTAPIEIYRIDGLDAGIATYRALRSQPRWSRYASLDLVPTAGLTRVMALDAQLNDSQGVLWTELPETLPAGWYLVQLASPTRPIQTMLQVTDIASYLVVSDTKTLLWTNDLATGGPLAGASAGVQGIDLGRTGANGTLIAATPRSIVPEPAGTCPEPCVELVTVRAGERSAFVPATEPSDPNGKGGGSGSLVDDGVRYWHAFDLDRSLYRTNDTVNAWGVVRDRKSGTVPDPVTVRLVTVDESTGGAGPLLVTKTIHPNKIGAFATSIALVGLPEGSYQLELRTADRLIATSGFQVGRILKPAYRLNVVTGRRVYVEGDQIRVTASATFYEGSPVPGIKLRTDGFVGASFTTDRSGTATRKVTAHVSADGGEETTGPQVQSLTVTPATAEEGEISSSSREIIVFPSHWTVAQAATLSGGRVRATGTLSVMARDRLERELSGGASADSLDPAGKVLADRAVTLTFLETITHKVKSGTHYDFVEKKVIPTYDYSTTERVADTIRVRTDAKGRFSASIKAVEGRSYRVKATARDTDGHIARSIDWASDPSLVAQEDSSPRLSLTTDANVSDGEFGVGDRIDLRMTDPAAVGEGAVDRYLFYTAQLGLRDVVVQDSGRFRTTFGRSAVPDLQIGAVRFDGSHYSETTAFEARFRATDRRLTVRLTADAARYAPGADVRIRVATRDKSGDPVPATVILRAVDEKLFTLGGAAAADPLAEIYTNVPSGIRVTYRSHRLPRPNTEDGGGDTTGGGRDDFRDSLLFKTVDTGADGRATVTMHLSDDLTSWHVGASAIGAGLSAGEGSILIPVGLPFFAEATIAPEYLVSDRPEIGLRAFGTALKTTSKVTFAVDSSDLGLHVHGLRAGAFETVKVALPGLTLGRHQVTITARTGSGSKAREDRLTRTFTVIASRLERTRTAYKEIGGISHLEGGAGLTEITVADAGVGRYAPLLFDLSDPRSGRLERVLAGAVASALAGSRFAAKDAVDGSSFDRTTYLAPDGGLSVVPYGSSDLGASVLAALVAPDRLDKAQLSAYLAKIAGDESETRERRNDALAGLAGLGSAVLPRIRAAVAEPDLTIRERIILAIGAATLGDARIAHETAGSLVDAYGEAVGDQARIRVGADAADTTEATAWMAILAAANDDPLAPRFWSYVEANPDADATYALHAVGFVTRMLDHAAPTPASFAYTSGGTRTVVTLGAGEAFHLTIVGSQLADFTVEPVTGSVAVTTSWREPVDPASFEPDPDVQVSRTIAPAGVVGASDLVSVDLVVEFGPLSSDGCHTVTDLVPSGLVPVGKLRGWVDPEDTEATAANATEPYAMSGQRVDFCAEPRAEGGTAKLHYVARVVSTGTYTWETAVAQSPLAPERAALTGATKIAIH